MLEPLLVAWVDRFSDRDDDARDVSQPVAYDSEGRPVFAPRGYTMR